MNWLSTPGARRATLGLALLSALASCEKNEEPARSIPGTYTGRVQLHDEFGARLTDNSGVEVSLYNNPDVTTQTAADGTFTLNGVPAGEHRVTLLKTGYGFYHTDPLAVADGGTLDLGRTVALAQRSTADLAYTYQSYPSAGYLVVRGTYQNVAPTDSRPRYHRTMFDTPVGYDGAISLASFKYSKMRRNNLPTGFADTIRLSTLSAHGVGRNTDLLIGPDNPAADSCTAPYGSTFPNDKTVRFGKYYPCFMVYRGMGGSDRITLSLY